jgi:fructose-1,6-bisphosphatase/sedoheptulose 1,7-bisphosphatase-like protein
MLESLSIEDIQQVTNSAAKSVIDLHGSMDKNSIDSAAVNAMRQVLNQIAMAGTVVIGEGQKDNAPMLRSGKK